VIFFIYCLTGILNTQPPFFSGGLKMKQGLKFKGFGLVILICLLFCFPASAWAADRYVDVVNGDNANDGTSATQEAPTVGPWKTLHYAIPLLISGDVLRVAAGTYSPGTEGVTTQLTVNVAQSNVTIQGAGPELTIIAGPQTGSWLDGILINASNVTIKDLAVRDFFCDGDCYPYAGIKISSGTGNIIEGCWLYDNGWGIQVLSGGIETKIRKNQISDNFTGIWVESVSGNVSPSILNNLIYDTSGTMDDGIYVLASGGTASPTIYHNTIDGGTSNGIYVYQFGGTASPDIKYNIITKFDNVGINNDSAYPGNPVIGYNDVWNNTAGNYSGVGPVLNDINLLPSFADAANGNFHLLETSPCIDAIPLAMADATIEDDFDGNPRPQGSGYDMGAYEYTVSISQPVSIPPGTQVADYRMVSFTMHPNDPACTSVFGDEMGGAYDPKNFKIGTYDPTINGYVECGSGLDIVPGRAYWMLARNGFDATVAGTPASMSDTVVALDYNATTDNGWNQIGCPNDANYAWGDVEVVDAGPIGLLSDENPWIDRRLWCWENGSYYPDNVFMERREGYWVKVRQANVSLRFPQSAQAALDQVSNQDIMFAGLFKKTKTWVNKWILGSQVAIADSGDSPPMPMEALSSSSADSEGGGGGGCFVDSLQ
jgi:hypothetical protein